MSLTSFRLSLRKRSKCCGSFEALAQKAQSVFTLDPQPVQAGFESQHDCALSEVRTLDSAVGPDLQPFFL